MSLQTLPKGLLLDFGGVIVNSEKPANWQQLVADEFLALVGSEPMVSRDRLIADITAGAVAAGLWRICHVPATPSQGTGSAHLRDGLHRR